MEDIKTAFVRTVFEKKSNLMPLFDIFKESVKDVILEKNSSAVETACVQTAGPNKFLIRVNKDFYETKLTGKYDLFWILIHELNHIVLNHLSFEGEENRCFINLCADINCNSLMFNLNAKKRLPVLERFYKNNYIKMIEEGLFRESRLCFLLFPPHKSREYVEKDFSKIKNLSEEQKQKLISLWFDNYFGEMMPVEKLIHRLREFVYDPAYFLYADIIQNMVKNPALYREIASKLSRYIEENVGSGNEETKLWHSGEINKEKVGKKAELLRKLIRKTVIKNSHSTERKNIWLDQQSVIPNFSRRQIALINCGVIPNFYQSKISTKAKTNEFSAVYIDQSGSMDPYKKLIYILLRKIADTFKGPYFVFATEVVKITLSDVKKNIFITGGTDINPVIAHINKNNFQKALIITDGIFKKAELTTGADIYAVFTNEYYYMDSLIDSIKFKGVWYLDD